MNLSGKLKQFGRALISEALLMRYRAWKITRTQHEYSKQSIREVFSSIYRHNVWGSFSGDVCSGEGSYGQYAEEYAARLMEILAERNIQSLADLGCGDCNVGIRLAPGVSQYIGVDVVQEVVERNQQRFGSDKVRFVCADITQDSLPPADACVVRQVLQHLTNAEVSAALRNILRSYRRAFITEHLYVGPGVRKNIDIPHGPNVRIPFKSGVFVLDAPFCMKGSQLFDLKYSSGYGGRYQVLRTWEILRCSDS